MFSRFTATGIGKDDQEVILAYQLQEDAYRLELFIIPRKDLSAEQITFLDNHWVKGEDFPFPGSTISVAPNLNSDSILPEEIRAEKEQQGKIRAKQNEWAYQILTAKLWETYLQELDTLKKRAMELTQYDRQLFDDAKSFWERVLLHRKERDISQERLDKIKEEVNSVFEKLKTFRKTESAEFEAASARMRDEVIALIEQIKSKADEKANFKQLAEDLKTLQNNQRKNRFTKTDDVAVRKQFDAVFQFINEQRHHFFSDKTASRIKGLTEVIQKMEQSLNRDKKDLEYLEKKTGSSIRALELQLIKVKQNLLRENIGSKEEKLKDIRSTLEKLQKQASKSQTGSTVSETTTETEAATDGANVSPAE